MAEISTWLDAQYSVLGSCLIEPKLVPKVVQECAESDFDGACQIVYRTMREIYLSGFPVDIVPLAHRLGNDYREFLGQLMDITPSAANLDAYIEVCKTQARISAAHQLGLALQKASTLDAIQRLIDKANGAMVRKASVKAYTMADCLQRFFDRHTGKAEYLSWPIQPLNSQLYTQAGDFIVIGGLPSTGKSAWSLQCAWHWAKDHKVGFYSLETGVDRLFDRQMSALTQISKDNIKRNKLQSADWDKVAAMSGDITSRQMEIIEAAGWTAADIRAYTMQRGFDVIFVDYLQLLAADGRDRFSQVTNISIALHTMAQSLGVVVVAMSQLSRQTGNNSAPEMSQLRESGQIEQDADAILLLKLENEKDPSGARILRIVKNKEGERGKIRLGFDGKTQLFFPCVEGADAHQPPKQKKEQAPPPAPPREIPGQFDLMPADTYTPF